MEGHPIELAIGNVVRRVLFIVRREFATASAEEKEGKEGKAGDKGQQKDAVCRACSVVC